MLCLPMLAACSSAGALYDMLGKIWTPGTAAGDEWLHQRAFRLDGMVEVMCGPFVQHLAQGDEAVVAVLRRAVQVCLGDARQQHQVLLAGAGECGGKLCGRFLRLPCLIFVWIEGGDILPRQE